MIQTQQLDRVNEALQNAVLQQYEEAVNGGSNNGDKTGDRTPIAVGSGTPGPGRPRGVKNKLTNLRDAVIEAFDRVGGVEYLVKLANGTQSDRAAFTSLMNKVLPTQINQQVDGGIRLELSWLGGRNIGTTAAQIPEHRTQVLDLETDSDGKYRIKDQASSPEGVAGGSPQGVPGRVAGQDAQEGSGGAQGA